MNVTVGVTSGYPLEHVQAVTMPVEAGGQLRMSVMLGEPHANNWYLPPENK